MTRRADRIARRCATSHRTHKTRRRIAMPRIPLITESSELTPAQRRVVEGILGRRGGRIPGPYRFGLHCPEVTEAWHPLGEVLRLKSTFPLRLSELAIIVAARAMDCDYVFNAHAPAAIKAGL